MHSYYFHLTEQQSEDYEDSVTGVESHGVYHCAVEPLREAWLDVE